MKYLLDTHTLLWFFSDVENLPQTSFGAIMDPLNEIYVSIVSAWELAIKISIGKLIFDGGVNNFFKVIRDNGFTIISVKEDYVKLIEYLPLIHRDPFDRMLVATAVSEKMSIITADANIHKYSVDCIWQ